MCKESENRVQRTFLSEFFSARAGLILNEESLTRLLQTLQHDAFGKQIRIIYLSIDSVRFDGRYWSPNSIAQRDAHTKEVVFWKDEGLKKLLTRIFKAMQAIDSTAEICIADVETLSLLGSGLGRFERGFGFDGDERDDTRCVDAVISALSDADYPLRKLHVEHTCWPWPLHSEELGRNLYGEAQNVLRHLTSFKLASP